MPLVQSWRSFAAGFVLGALGASTLFLLASKGPELVSKSPNRRDPSSLGPPVMADTVLEGEEGRREVVERFTQYLDTSGKAELPIPEVDPMPDLEPNEALARVAHARRQIAGQGISMGDAPDGELITDRGRDEWLRNRFLSTHGEQASDEQLVRHRRVLKRIARRVQIRVIRQEGDRLTQLGQTNPQGVASETLEIARQISTEVLQEEKMEGDPVIVAARVQLALDAMSRLGTQTVVADPPEAPEDRPADE